MCDGRLDAIVIGAGVAGLTAAAALAERRAEVLVVERHNVAGGCASYFQRDGFRFDVGATLAGGFGSRGAHRLLNARFGADVSPERIEPAMVVHLPDVSVVRYGDARWPAERLRAFGAAAEPFWRRQERIADLAWDFSARFPALPVDAFGALAFAAALRPRSLALAATLGRTVGDIVPPGETPRLRAFLDAQLLITAQTDAAHADLAYGATALDLAREGTYHLPGGIGDVAVALARAVRAMGSRVAYRSEVRAVTTRRGRVTGVELATGERLASDRVIAAVPVQTAARLTPALERALRPRLAERPQRWGAFVVYAALPPGVVPDDLPVHHQVVHAYGRPPGEGETAFLSFSGAGDARRARGGGRAVTLSTHTDVARWERAHADGTVDEMRARYAARLLDALERVLPGARERLLFAEAADPHTFERYTGRDRGLVGGLPQTPATAVVGAFSHRTPVHGLYLCGDTTFPGQSTVGAALGGFNAGRAAAGISSFFR